MSARRVISAEKKCRDSVEKEEKTDLRFGVKELDKKYISQEVFEAVRLHNAYESQRAAR